MFCSIKGLRTSKYVASCKSRINFDLSEFKMGSPEDMGNFINAVIDEKSFDKIAGYIDFIKGSNEAEIITGGNYDKTTGYFIEPTVVVTSIKVPYHG